MTGKHTGHATIRGNKGSLAPTDIVFPEILQQNGYQTSFFGKSHLGDGFSAHFNESLEFVHGPGTTTSFYYSNKILHNGVLKHFSKNNHTSRAKCMGDPSSCTYMPAYLKKKMLRYLNTIDTSTPFFTYYATNAPHIGSWSDGGYGYPVPSYKDYATRANWTNNMKGYAAIITYHLDRYVGHILDFVEHHPSPTVRDNTLVLFTSDNGPHFDIFEAMGSAGPLRGQKRSLHDGGVRMPFLAWWPAKITANVTRSTPFASWDVFPTLLDLACVDSSRLELDGQSIKNLLFSQGPVLPKPNIYHEFCAGGLAQPDERNRWSYAVRVDNYKGINHGNGTELFDLSVDIGETNDIAAQHPDIVAYFEQVQHDAHIDSNKWPVENCVKT